MTTTLTQQVTLNSNLMWFKTITTQILPISSVSTDIRWQINYRKLQSNQIDNTFLNRWYKCIGYTVFLWKSEMIKIKESSHTVQWITIGLKRHNASIPRSKTNDHLLKPNSYSLNVYVHQVVNIHPRLIWCSFVYAVRCGGI